MAEVLDVIIIGGGQSALACGYYLNRTGLSFKILDKQENCGGSWQQMWDSLTMFSPAEHSSLPGWLMPKSKNKYPVKEEVVEYLCRYESRYNLPVIRPAEVTEVHKDKDGFIVISTAGTYRSKTVISATGTWEKPVIPEIKGRANFKGLQLHSSGYEKPEDLGSKKVLVVGEGNSGAQILSEVSKATTATWATLRDPAFLPDDVDGKFLFNIASAKYRAQQQGKKFNPAEYNLGDIVMVPPVKEARERDVLKSAGVIKEVFDQGVVWETGGKENFDAIIWCTGFGFATDHLKNLVNLDERGKTTTANSKALEMDGLWLVGYGGWTGYASATVIGVGRTARQTIKEIQEYLN